MKLRNLGLATCICLLVLSNIPQTSQAFDLQTDWWYYVQGESIHYNITGERGQSIVLKVENETVVFRHVVLNLERNTTIEGNISTTHLPPGAIFISIRNGTNYIERKVIVVMNSQLFWQYMWDYQDEQQEHDDYLLWVILDLVAIIVFLVIFFIVYWHEQVAKVQKRMTILSSFYWYYKLKVSGNPHLKIIRKPEKNQLENLRFQANCLEYDLMTAQDQVSRYYCWVQKLSELKGKLRDIRTRLVNLERDRGVKHHRKVNVPVASRTKDGE